MSDTDYGYLEDGIAALQTQEVLSNIAAVGNKLKELKQRMIDTEVAAKKAAAEYKHYAEVVVPMQMKASGLDSVKLVSGGTLSIKHNLYCQPNKNEKDQKIMADWLIKHGGEGIVKQEARVDQSSLDSLSEAGIPYAVTTSINTNSLKAFIKNALGLSKGAVKRIDVADIPPCIHFSMIDTAEVTDE